jgi:hypothetical protein
MLYAEPRGQAARYLARIAQMETVKVDSLNSSPVCEDVRRNLAINR